METIINIPQVPLVHAVIHSPHLITTIALAILSIVVLRGFITAAYNIFFHPLRFVPGPYLAKISNFYMLTSFIQYNRAQTVYDLHRKYGPVVRVAPNEVSIADWRAYRTIYNTNISTKDVNFYHRATTRGIQNIFSITDKAQHRGRKKMQTEPYSQAAVLANESLIADKARILVDRIIKSAGSSQSGFTTDVYVFCGMFSLDVILQCGFNHDAGEGMSGDALELLHAMDKAARKVLLDVEFPFLGASGIGKFLPGWVGDAFRGQAIWERMTSTLLKKFDVDEKSRDKQQRFMATPFLTNQDSFLGRRLNDDEVLEEAMSMTFAGSGTTSTTLFYLIYAMSRPESAKWQAKLRAELQEAQARSSKNVDGSKDRVALRLNELQALPFLSAVISETMRVYPTIISTLPRRLETQLTLTVGIDTPKPSTYVFPPSTTVGMQNYVHHRDPVIFPEPESFLPERWISESNPSKLSEMNSALTPFSLGTRACIGQNLARAELYLATAEIFSRAELKLNESMTPDLFEMEDRFNIAPRGRKLLVDVFPIQNS